ncbi:hypothetical protein GJAV_G00245420 [Gymnothorax javanicus]|nr:hypothetical protein GJAV_G00245420 [Gymnothorax javanicus]
MPRRKQQAPRRAAAYVPEELKEAALLDVGAEETDATDEEPSAKYRCSEDDLPGKEPVGLQDSPTDRLSSHEMDSESHISESSDRISDFESASVKNEEMIKEPPMIPTTKTLPREDAPTGPDSLDRMKDIYASFLNNSYWSPLSLNLAHSEVEKSQQSSSCSSSSSSSSSGGYDWHQSAIAKSLQQSSQSNRMSPEPNVFNAVHVHSPQKPKLFGPVFTGASKFRCKDCSAAYDTLVELTVHMNETGHYRDDNHEKDKNGSKRWSKPRKRSLMEMEGQEDAQRVLKCMYCGHSFESLQDLSVHMIKTKHYQKVPLKEPMNPMATKLTSSIRNRSPAELDFPSSPQSPAGALKPPLMDTSGILQKATYPNVSSRSRQGQQNGTSYAWQFESRKSQILKCMDCGSSYNNLQELTAHMMVTGHFMKVTNSSTKRGKHVTESLPALSALAPAEDKFQSVPLAATSFPTPLSVSSSPKMCTEIKEEEKEKPCLAEIGDKDAKYVEEEDKDDVKPSVSKYPYLTEDDLKDSPKGGLDILKSLENTVTSAINKAQNGTPSWGGYPSIHAAYQLPNIVKLSMASSEKNSPLKYMFPGESLSPNKSQTLIPPMNSTLPQNNFHAMEELVKKVSEKVAKVEEKIKNHRAKASPHRRATPSPCSSDTGGSSRRNSPKDRRAETPETNNVSHKNCNGNSLAKDAQENGTETAKNPPSVLSGSTAIITDHPPEQPFINPLSALQSIMNVHLGKAAKPALPTMDPMSMLFKMSNSLAEKAAVATPPVQTKKTEPAERYFYYASDDQPIDLTKGKRGKCSPGATVLAPTSTSSSMSFSPSSTVTMAKSSLATPFISNSPVRENALSDISDMLRNLTEGRMSKSSTPASLPEVPDPEVLTQDGSGETSPAQKRKGRQSNWNPQHLLILQAQFTSSLRQGPDGKYVMSDLTPQERMFTSRFTGLSMTTISHWLANVKYQLRRTGGTKFLKNLDSNNPVFFCSDCASQVRTPSAYITHLESHLGFKLRDLAKLSTERTGGQVAQHAKGLSDKLLLAPSPSPSSSPSPSPSLEEEGNGASYQCKLCDRTFGSKHAIKLHLSKTHGKSPEDHLLYVCELEKQ